MLQEFLLSSPRCELLYAVLAAIIRRHLGEIMSRNDNYRRGNKKSGWNKNSSNERSDRRSGGHPRQRGESRRPVISAEQQKAIAENENAIKNFKANAVRCEMCGEIITDLSSALNNKKSGAPVHFDCVLQEISKRENPGPNEKITYIGNGKFAVLYFENVHDMRHFSIKREIEWENRDSERGEWRDTMAGLYSQVR